MLREELTAALRSLEAERGVDDWLWDGWRAWPVVRSHLALALHSRAARVPVGPGARLARLARRRREQLRAWARHVRDARPDLPAEAVFLTSSDRGQRVDRCQINTVVDPWAEAIERRGGSARVWDLGRPRRFAAPGHASVEWASQRCLRRAARSARAEPSWYGELAAAAERQLGWTPDWSALRTELMAVSEHAALFEPWLRRASPRMVLLDAWYLRERMGAALAARRLGIPSVDLQHGIQGRGHPAYAGWVRAPRAPYEVVPDRFWVWGEWDARALAASNPGVIERSRVRIVGNRWLSLWVGDEPRFGATRRAARRLVGGRRAVLVTLQKGVPFRDWLLPMLDRAPRDWLWLVRLHRSMGEDARRLQAELRRTHAGVDVLQATQLPLYALMDASHWHVTAFSTCALEALAFGVPTLLAHASGEHAFGEFLESGVMQRHRCPDASLALLGSGDAALREACRAAARGVFGQPEPPWLEVAA